MAWQVEQAPLVPLKTAWPRRMSPGLSVASSPSSLAVCPAASAASDA